MNQSVAMHISLVPRLIPFPHVRKSLGTRLYMCMGREVCACVGREANQNSLLGCSLNLTWF